MTHYIKLKSNWEIWKLRKWISATPIILGLGAFLRVVSAPRDSKSPQTLEMTKKLRERSPASVRHSKIHVSTPGFLSRTDFSPVAALFVLRDLSLKFIPYKHSELWLEEEDRESKEGAGDLNHLRWRRRREAKHQRLVFPLADEPPLRTTDSASKFKFKWKGYDAQASLAPSLLTECLCPL